MTGRLGMTLALRGEKFCSLINCVCNAQMKRECAKNILWDPPGLVDFATHPGTGRRDRAPGVRPVVVKRLTVCVQLRLITCAIDRSCAWIHYPLRRAGLWKRKPAKLNGCQ